MRRAASIAAILLASCGGGGSAAPVPEAIFADATLRSRAEAAPELLREAEEALGRARSSRDPDVAQDLATEARLLFLAAAAEGERRLLAPSRGAAGRADVDAARDAAIRRAALAVALASTEAEAVTEAARELEETRWRSREGELVASRRAALDVVVARTRVLLGALAGPVGAEPSEVAALESRLEELRARRDPTEALDGVDRLRRELEARVARPGSDGAEVVAAAASEGLAAEPIDGLWVIDLGVAGARTNPASENVERARRLVSRLAARRWLLVAEGPPRAPLDRVLASTEAAITGGGVDRTRVTSLAVTAAGFPEPRVTLRFVGYRTP